MSKSSPNEHESVSNSAVIDANINSMSKNKETLNGDEAEYVCHIFFEIFIFIISQHMSYWTNIISYCFYIIILKVSEEKNIPLNW